MADQSHKPQGTFSKLMSSTLPHQEQRPEKLENQQSRMPAIQQSSKLEIKNSGKPEIRNVGNPAIQQTGKPKSLANQVPTEKVSYRFHAEGKYAIEDMKMILARKHGIKASLEEIAEACILLAYDDLLENQNASKLANRLSSMPANKKSS
jgi:hypothetical protein